MKLIKNGITYFLVMLIKIYKHVISPWTPNACRHVPTCSSYAISAVQMHGPLRGGLLSLRRLSKCHPWGTHGYDPVPKEYNKIKIKKITL
ncbi:MAG: membrane protein insertion efficiency factor YidD [Bacteroidales bacterium]